MMTVKADTGPIRRRWHRLAAAVPAALLLALGAGSGTAQAHAMLESSTPRAGAVVASAPTQLRLHFDEPVQISAGSLTVLDANGKPVEVGTPTHPGGLAPDMAVPLKSGLADGTYLVLWRVISADSHPVDNTFTFSVGHPGSVAAASAPTTSKTVAGLLGAARGVGYLGIAVFLGGVWFVLLCWPEGGAERRSRRLTLIAFLTAEVGALAALLLQGPYGAGLGVSDTFDSQVISGTVDGRYGHAVLARIALLAVTAVVGWWTLRRPGWRSGLLFTAVGVGMLSTFAWTGHAGIGSQVPLAVISDLGHLSAMSLWLGGLAQLALCTIPGAPEPVARKAAARFSPLALISVLVLIASGTYQAWRQAGILDSLTTTHYGRLLLVKIGLVVAIVVVAFFSRQWVQRNRDRVVVAAHSDTEQLTGSAVPVSTRGRLSGLRATVALEAVLILVVLGVTSFLVSAQPARSAYRPATTVNVATGPVTVHISIVPAGSRMLDINLYTFAASGAVVTVPELDVTMTLPSKNLGPITIPVTHISGSHFLATDVMLPYAGQWRLGLKVRTTAIDEYDTTTKVTVR